MVTQSPMIAAVAAIDLNSALGKDNRLLWHLPADLHHFKTLTTGHPIIMGRKTYLSIGKALPNRTNIIVTHDKQFAAQGCLITHSIPEALQLAQTYAPPIFIIGGGEIYRAAWGYLTDIYLTIVHHTFDGDVFFPNIDPNIWQEVERQDFAADEQNPYPYSFIRYTIKRT